MEMNLAVGIPEGEGLLTLREVADVLRTSVKTVRRRIDQGKLISVKEGGGRRVWRSELRRYLSALKPANS